MIKRYRVYPYVHAGEYPKVELLDKEVTDGKWCKYDDIKDSLIVWHDLRKDPKDLPPLQCYVFVSGGENSHVAALLPEGWHFLGNVPTFKIIEWAYVPKSPKE